MSGYDNFVARAKLSGMTMRDTIVNDAVRLEALENERDPSYCKTFYRWINGICARDGVQIHPRLYDRKHSSAVGHTVKMKTLLSEPVTYGDTFHNTAEDTWWMCTAVDRVDDINYISTLTECNYTLKFQMGDAPIYEYKCQDLNSTQYNSGVTDSKQTTLLSSQHMLTLPQDDIILSLQHDKRFFLTANPVLSPDVYELTQNDTTSHKGLCKVTVTQKELNTNKDNVELGICDYISPDDPKPPIKTDILSKIEYTSTDIKVGTSGRKFYAKFVTKDSEEVADLTPLWTIEADFRDSLVCNTSDNYITIATHDENLIDSQFTLKLTDTTQQANTDEITVNIIGLF